MPRKQIASLMMFGKALLRDQRCIGAVTPSSWALSRRMASYIPEEYDGYVVELGPGTGSITEALLKRGLDPKRFYAIEFTPDLAEHVRKRFPGINVVVGDAVNLKELLPPEVTENGLEYIISGLPLRAMGQEKVDQIIGTIRDNLTENGSYVQFTYSHARNRNRIIKDLHMRDTSIVWLNVPPARVDVFETNGKSNGQANEFSNGKPAANGHG